MYNRFNSYLTNEFRGLPKSKEVMDFKEELVGNLMARYEELSIKNEASEDDIFKDCINSINGFKDTLKVIRGNPIIIKDAKKVVNALLFTMLYFLIVVGIYLTISFITEEWSKSWLIIVGGSFVFFITINLFLANKAFVKKKFGLMRFSLCMALFLIVVAVYLGISFYNGMWSKTWLVMLWLPVAMLLMDIIVATVLKYRKTALGETLAIVPMIAVFIYLTLAILGTIAWHPFWLIILGGVFIEIAIIAITLKINSNK